MNLFCMVVPPLPCISGIGPPLILIFFCGRSLNLDALEGNIPFLRGAKTIQREKNTLTAIVDRGDPVKVSFSGLPRLPRLAQPHAVKENNLKIASLLDLAGTKASVIQVRAEAKDYLDMDAVLTSGKIDLPTALSAAPPLPVRKFVASVESARRPSY